MVAKVNNGCRLVEVSMLQIRGVGVRMNMVLNSGGMGEPSRGS